MHATTLRPTTKRKAGEYDQRIGAVVRDARVRAGLTQTDLARLIGVTFQQVQKYESGTNRLPASAYPILFEELGLSPQALFGAGDTDEHTRPPRSRSAIELDMLFERLGPTRKTLLLQVARELARR